MTADSRSAFPPAEYELALVIGFIQGIRDHLDEVNADWFTESACRDIFVSIGRVRAKGAEPDMVNVGLDLQERGVVKESLVKVLERLPIGRTFTGDLAFEAVRDAYIRRQADAILHESRDALKSGDTEATFADLDRRLDALRGIQPVQSSNWTEDMAFVLEHWNRDENLVPTGWRAMDDLVTGFEPTEFIVIGGRPGVGKTTFALNLLANMNRPSGFVSMEMGRRKVGYLGLRILQKQSAADLDRFKDQHAALRALLLESECPTRMIYRSGLTPLQFQALARSLKQKHGTQILVLDNLNLMHDPTSRNAGRVQELSAITRAIKNTAMDLGIVVIAISHLNRQADGRTDSRPVLTDLRDSGSVEQDADCVLFLWRLDYQRSHNNGHTGPTELIMRKGRGRKLGTAYFKFDDATQIFTPTEAPRE